MRLSVGRDSLTVVLTITSTSDVTNRESIQLDKGIIINTTYCAKLLSIVYVAVGASFSSNPLATNISWYQFFFLLVCTRVTTNH
jgi:hypothetical protein